VTFATVSSCRVTAKQAGTAGYAAATAVAWNFSTTKAPQAITFNHPSGSVGGPTNRFLAGDHLVLTSTDLFASSGLAVNVAITGTGCTARTGTVNGDNTVQIDFVAPGSCQVSVTQGGNGSYAAAPTIGWNPKVVAS
jgi:hypothetical protein